MAWEDRCSAVHAQRAIYSHTLFASINRNCEIGIKLVSRVQIPVETSLEKLFRSKIKNLKISKVLENIIKSKRTILKTFRVDTHST